MAIAHCPIRNISCGGKTKCMVAAAAYRVGEKLTDEFTGITYDYAKKADVLLPANAPERL